MSGFDKKAYMTMVLAIIIIVGIIAVISLKSDKKVITPTPQIREGLRDIVN